MDEFQDRALKSPAREGDTTIAALVRESIEKYLDSGRPGFAGFFHRLRRIVTVTAALAASCRFASSRATDSLTCAAVSPATGMLPINGSRIVRARKRAACSPRASRRWQNSTVLPSWAASQLGLARERNAAAWKVMVRARAPALYGSPVRCNAELGGITQKLAGAGLSATHGPCTL